VPGHAFGRVVNLSSILAVHFLQRNGGIVRNLVELADAFFPPAAQGPAPGPGKVVVGTGAIQNKGWAEGGRVNRGNWPTPGCQAAHVTVGLAAMDGRVRA